jgi:hypothetical protein
MRAKGASFRSSPPGRIFGAAGQARKGILITTNALYVDSVNGNDDNTYEQARNPLTPWRTIGRAAWGSTNRSAPDTTRCAQPGDDVIIQGGTYIDNTYVGNRQDVLYNCARSGTVLNPIRFIANGTVILGAPTANSSVIGASAREYIHWYANPSLGHSFVIVADPLGITVDGTSANPLHTNTKPDTGPTGMYGSLGCRIEGANISSAFVADYLDNYPGCRIETSVDCFIKNCTIFGFHNNTDSVNGAGVQIYNCLNCGAENNHIYDCGSGVIQKNAPTLTFNHGGNIVRWNIIHDITGPLFEGSFVSTVITAGSETPITRNYTYQNIGYNAKHVWAMPGTRGVVEDWFYNNTFWNITKPEGVSGVRVSSSLVGGGRFWNNIIHTVNSVSGAFMLTIEAVGETMPTAAMVSYQNNVYFNRTGSGNFFSSPDTGNLSFSDYRFAFSTQDTTSLDTDPLLIDPSGGNFRLLNATSPAWTLGRDLNSGAVIRAGAYINDDDVIGVET